MKNSQYHDNNNRITQNPILFFFFLLIKLLPTLESRASLLVLLVSFEDPALVGFRSLLHFGTMLFGKVWVCWKRITRRDVLVLEKVDLAESNAYQGDVVVDYQKMGNEWDWKKEFSSTCDQKKPLLEQLKKKTHSFGFGIARPAFTAGRS